MADEPIVTPAPITEGGPTHTNPMPSSAQTAIAAQLTKLFPDGRLPEPTQLRAGEKPAGYPGAVRDPDPGPTGPIGEPGPTGNATGPTIPLDTPTGPPAVPAQSGATGPVITGPPEPAASGPAITGPTAEQLDAAGNKMEIKAGTAFKHVRDENARLTEANNLLIAKAKELEGKTVSEADKAEVAALKAKVDRYEKELSVSHVESTDDFIKNITKPLEKASNDLKAMAAKYDAAPGALAAALGEPDINKRSDLLSDLSANWNKMDQNRLERLVTEIDQRLEMRQSEIESASTKWKEIQANADRTAAQAATEFQQNWKAALETSFFALEKEPFFKLTGDAVKDAELLKLRESVKATDVSKLSNEALASSLYKAGAFPIVLGLITDAYAENVQLSDQITKLRGATPPVGGGIVPPQVVPNTVQPTTLFRDVLKQKLTGVLPP